MIRLVNFAVSYFLISKGVWQYLPGQSAVTNKWSHVYKYIGFAQGSPKKWFSHYVANSLSISPKLPLCSVPKTEQQTSGWNGKKQIHWPV